ncbi:MAG: hypothetical protein U9R69_00610 [Thermodesulfobacteriota bacterium]|nr:hypothetical protein [Thermodesulfobacteriota bacterium]
MKKTISTMVMALAIGVLLSFSSYAMESMQTQPSSDGKLEASLLSAKVRREVLTIKIMLKNISPNKVYTSFNYDAVYYSDIDDKKKYFVLKDSEGQYIAGPIDKYRSFRHDIQTDGQMIVWVKFPAPPETTETIDVFIPMILPFEEIEITR